MSSVPNIGSQLGWDGHGLLGKHDMNLDISKSSAYPSNRTSRGYINHPWRMFFSENQFDNSKPKINKHRNLPFPISPLSTTYS